jgi:hypothetical protein
MEETIMFARKFKPGDEVVYRKSKQTTQPGPRAQQIRPCPKGDNYTYTVDKFWVIQQVRDNGELVVGTRRGKTHVIEPSDRNLRHPTLWERLRYRASLAQLRQQGVSELGHE